MIERTLYSVDFLCRKHTDLSDEDIKKIDEVARSLPFIADLNQANVFVDCPTSERNHAIVVAEAAPNTTNSLYKKPVAGKFAYEAFEPAVFFVLRTGKPMFLNRALTQEGKTVEQSVVPIQGNSNRIIGTLIMEKDISDKLINLDKMEALSQANESLSEILIGLTENRSFISEVIEESLFIIDENQRIQYVNPVAINLVFELSSQVCKVGAPFHSYFPSLEDLFLQNDELLMKEVSIQNKVFQLKRINLFQEQQSKGCFVIFRDVTELREKERELRVKTVALREIHHRVKNNLQTVASLLRLQMRRGIPEESKVHFIESLNRILSIASVYEIILANSDVEDDVELVPLIQKIGDMLVYSDDHDHKNISIYYNGPKLLIKSKLAVSIALVINELIQNSIKHAFSGRPCGSIHLVLEHTNHRLLVQVLDDGIGLTKDYKPSLGLDIVKMMVEDDLSGTFTITSTEEGTKGTVEFPLEGM